MLETLLRPGDTVERCGLILQNGDYIELPNIAENPEISFEINAVDLLPFVDSGQIAGTWHTHPTSSPNLSGEDRETFLVWANLKHVIIGMEDGKPAAKTYFVEEGLVLQCE